MSDIKHARTGLVARILEGEGHASATQRRAAFDNAGLTEPIATLIDKVAKSSHKVTDDEASVAAVLSDLETAPIEEPLRATLRILRKMTREQAVNADDMRTLLSSGVSRKEIEDALAVCFVFNITARLANAFGFALPSREALDAGAKYLLARGYR